jgi:hypothetical protein
MQRHQPPFRADHVRSLLRPPELLKARDEFRHFLYKVAIDEQMAKLRLIAETAREVWG